MAESAGRYCPLCGEAAGLRDRSCRQCGESLQVPAPPSEGRIPTQDANVPQRREGWGFGRSFSALVRRLFARW